MIVYILYQYSMNIFQIGFLTLLCLFFSFVKSYSKKQQQNRWPMSTK